MRLGLVVALSGLIAACGSAPTSSAPEASVILTPAPSGSASGASVAPSGVASQAPIATLPVSPSASPTAPGPSGSPSGAAGACSGNDKNRGFFETFASSVTWDVYCAVVPDGWFITSGSYHLRDGGQLDVVYQGPNGARLELEEGSFCTDGASACAPHDSWIGTAQFGDRSGQLASVGGGFAIYVDPGEKPAWQAVAAGLDQGTFEGLAQELVPIRP